MITIPKENHKIAGNIKINMFQEESQDIEYKESWKDEYLKWICGFANAHGGRIFIGINDEKEVVGIKNSKQLMEDITPQTYLEAP